MNCVCISDCQKTGVATNLNLVQVLTIVQKIFQKFAVIMVTNFWLQQKGGCCKQADQYTVDPNLGYPNLGYPNLGYPNLGYPNLGYLDYSNGRTEFYFDSQVYVLLE